MTTNTTLNHAASNASNLTSRGLAPPPHSMTPRGAKTTRTEDERFEARAKPHTPSVQEAVPRSPTPTPRPIIHRRLAGPQSLPGAATISVSAVLAVGEVLWPTGSPAATTSLCALIPSSLPLSQLQNPYSQHPNPLQSNSPTAASKPPPVVTESEVTPSTPRRSAASHLVSARVNLINFMVNNLRSGAVRPSSVQGRVVHSTVTAVVSRCHQDTDRMGWLINKIDTVEPGVPLYDHSTEQRRLYAGITGNPDDRQLQRAAVGHQPNTSRSEPLEYVKAEMRLNADSAIEERRGAMEAEFIQQQWDMALLQPWPESSENDDMQSAGNQIDSISPAKEDIPNINQETDVEMSDVEDSTNNTDSHTDGISQPGARTGTKEGINTIYPLSRNMSCTDLSNQASVGSGEDKSSVASEQPKSNSNLNVKQSEPSRIHSQLSLDGMSSSVSSYWRYRSAKRRGLRNMRIYDEREIEELYQSALADVAARNGRH